MQFGNFKIIAFSTLITLLASCSFEDVSPIPPKSWLDGTGTAQADEVFLDFKNMLYKSATEVHSYRAEIKDQRVEGTFEVYNFDKNGGPVSDAKGQVICIAFEEDCKTARITGVITSGSDPAFAGLYAIWTVVDNGMDINETTDIRYPIDQATADYHCEVGVPLEWYNFDSYFSCEGKVQVRALDCF
jgi:hypothetical protein